MSSPLRTALLVPVPEAELAVGRFWSAWDPPKAQGIPAHVTVLFPFVPAEEVDGPVLTALTTLVGRHAAFELTLARTARFAELNLLYLEPEPAEAFVALTEAVWGAFPEYPPYDGEYDMIVPHLTSFRSPNAELIASVERELADALPIRSRVGDVWLMEERPGGRWERRAAFGLGAAA